MLAREPKSLTISCFQFLGQQKASDVDTYIYIDIYIYIYKKRGARNETKRIALVNGDLIAKIRRLFSRLGCYGVSSSRIDRAKPAARIGSTWQS